MSAIEACILEQARVPFVADLEPGALRVVGASKGWS